VAFVHGKNTYIAIDDAGGTLRDLSSFCDNVSGLPGTRDLAETTSFGANGTQSIPGLENVEFSISGSFDPTATTGPHAVINSLRAATAPGSFVYCPQGNSAGNVQISGECWLSSYEVESEVDDKVSFEAEFQVEGTVTVGTVPS
jgi:hypothetical protein